VDPIGIVTKKETTMTKRKRRHYDEKSKFRVALEGTKELKTLARIIERIRGSCESNRALGKDAFRESKDDKEV